LAYLNKGIRLNLTDERQHFGGWQLRVETYFSEKGLVEFVKYLDGTRMPLIEDVIYMEGEKQGIPVEIAMVYNDSYTRTCTPTSTTSTPMRAVRTWQASAVALPAP
jgi:DNA gyrase subunit B